MKAIIIFLLLVYSNAQGQDSTYLKVHFLYGSKPIKKYKESEKKWFGGKLGGHVGIESESQRIVNFRKKGKYHRFAKCKDKHSMYVVYNDSSFYSIFGSHPDSVKKAIVYVPVSKYQKVKFDSIATSYINQVPYDYALFGMRCGAASYEILGQLDILPRYSNRSTIIRIFIPKYLRKKLLKLACKNNWTVEHHIGTQRRKWEKD